MKRCSRILTASQDAATSFQVKGPGVPFMFQSCCSMITSVSQSHLLAPDSSYHVINRTLCLLCRRNLDLLASHSESKMSDYPADSILDFHPLCHAMLAGKRQEKNTAVALKCPELTTRLCK